MFTCRERGEVDTEIALEMEHRAIDGLIGLFAGLDKDGKLPIGSMVYLDKAWLEIRGIA